MVTSEVIGWMEKKTNTYTSHDIQNECLQIMALQILWKVNQSICHSLCFSTMADECTNVANLQSASGG